MVCIVRKIQWILYSLFYCSLVMAGQLPNPDSLKSSARVQINENEDSSLKNELLRQGFDVLGHGANNKSIEIVVSPGELEFLRDKGISYSVLEVGRPLRQITLESGQADYLDVLQLDSAMQALAGDYPEIASYVDVTETYGGEATVEGRHIYAIKISDNVTENEDETPVLLVGAHHSREIVTPVILLHAIEQLTTKYNSDSGIKDLVDNNEIWIAPLWNPDGYNFVFTGDNLWRKNRRVFGQGIGVDQNRNYPTGWTGDCAGSDDVNTEIYRGPSSASEAETKTMIAFTLEEKFAKVLDFHSHGRQVVWGYGCNEVSPWDNWFEEQAISLANSMGYDGSVRGPAATGEHYQWQMARGAFAVLPETQLEFQPSYDDAVIEAEQVWPGIISMLAKPVSLYGHVTDFSGNPIEAQLVFLDVDFNHGETFETDSGTGSFHFLLPPGTYDMNISAIDYLPLDTFVTVTDSSSQLFEIKLQSIISVAKDQARHKNSKLEFATHSLHPDTRKLRLYNTAGENIRVLYKAHTNGFTWDFKDSKGHKIPGGVYFYQTDLGESNKILLVPPEL